MPDGNPTPNLEPRVAVLEQIAVETRDALLRIDRRLDAIEHDVKPALARLEGRFDSMESRFSSLERHFDARFGSLERRMDTLERRQHTDFIALLTIMLGGYASMLGVMAHGFHWI